MGMASRAVTCQVHDDCAESGLWSAFTLPAQDPAPAPLRCCLPSSREHFFHIGSERVEVGTACVTTCCRLNASNCLVNESLAAGLLDFEGMFIAGQCLCLGPCRTLCCNR